MTKKQRRKSISISGDLYEKLKVVCLDNNMSMAGLAENLLRRHIGMPTSVVGPIHMTDKLKHLQEKGMSARAMSPSAREIVAQFHRDQWDRECETKPCRSSRCSRLDLHPEGRCAE